MVLLKVAWTDILSADQLEINTAEQMEVLVVVKKAIE